MKQSSSASAGGPTNRLRTYKKIQEKQGSSQVSYQPILDLDDEDQPYDLTTQNEESLELAAQKIKLRHDLTEQNIELAPNKEIPKEIPEDNDEDSDEDDFVMDDEDKNKINSLKLTTAAESKLKYNLDDLNGLSQNNSKFCKVLVHLLLKNKISSKNAFDIKIPILDQLAGIDFSQHSAWKLLSSGLGAGAKIWGYKVDNTYGDTMKVLQKLFRIDAFDQDEMKLLNNKGPAGIKQKKQQLAFNIEEASKNADTAGSKTLEQHTDCLNADLYDLEFDKDPTFWRTSLSFDIKSAETMLLNKLPMDSNFGYVVDSEEKITLRVDKRLEEIEERVDSGASSANPQIDKSMASFVIRRKGQERSGKVTLYEVIVGQVEEINEADRERQIAELIRPTHTLMPLDKNNGKLISTLEDGLCEELTQFAQFVQSEGIFSESTQRWSYKDKRRDQKLAQYDLDKFQVEHQSLESRREEGKREQERLDRENKVDCINIAGKNNENLDTLKEEQAQDNQGKVSKGRSGKQIVEMIEGEEVEIDIEPITVIEADIEVNNDIGNVNLNEATNNIETNNDGMDEEPNNLESNYIKLLREQQEVLVSEDIQTQKTEWNEHVVLELEERKVEFNESIQTQTSKNQQEKSQDMQDLQQVQEQGMVEERYAIQNFQLFGVSENMQNQAEIKFQGSKTNSREQNYNSNVIASFFGDEGDEQQNEEILKEDTGKEEKQIQKKDIIVNKYVEEKKQEIKETQRVEEVEQVFLEGDEVEIDIEIPQGDQQIIEEDEGVHVLSNVQNKNLRKKKDFENVIDEILKRAEKPRENFEIDQDLRVLNRGDIKIGKGLKRNILWLQNQGQIEVEEQENGQLCLKKIEDGNISESSSSSSQEGENQDQDHEYYNPFALNIMGNDNQGVKMNKKYRNDDWSDESSVDICEQFLGYQFQERLEEKKKEKFLKKQERQFQKKMLRMQAEREGLGGETDVYQDYDGYSGKSNRLYASKHMEEEVEEEFRRMLEGEEINGAADALEMIVRCKSKRGSSKSLWIDFQEEEEEEESSSLIVFIDPYERIRRALGQQYNQSDNELLTGNELKNKKYVWGYKSVSMDIGQSESEGAAMFESKLFNVGKGTHRIDMRYSSLQQQKLKLHVDEGNQLQEFQLIQTSKLKLGRTREDWQRRKDRFNTKNLLYFNRILEGKEENYLSVIQPRLRTVQIMIDQERRSRQRYRGWAQQNRRTYFQSLYPRREILYILSTCINLDTETLGFLNSICEDYLHYLSLPTLTHFEITKSIQKQFEDTEALTMDISFDEIVDDREKDSQDLDNLDEIDFDLLDIGLYDALEIDRGGSLNQPSYSQIRKDMQTNGGEINGFNRRESSSKQWDQITRQLQQAADTSERAKTAQGALNNDMEVKILDEIDVKQSDELEEEGSNRNNLGKILDSNMNLATFGEVKKEEDDNGTGNSELTHNIKKKTINKNGNARGGKDKRRKKKKTVRIDLEKYSKDPTLGGSSDSMNNSSASSQEDGGDINQDKDFEPRNIQDITEPSGVVTRKQKRKIDEFCGISDENIPRSNEDSLEIELDEYDTGEQASQLLLRSQNKTDQQEPIFEEEQQQQVPVRVEQEINIELSFSSGDENQDNENDDTLKFMRKGKLANYIKNLQNNPKPIDNDNNSNINNNKNNDCHNHPSDSSFDSTGSIQEQYFHQEFAAYLPYNLDNHELSSFEPMVKWEVKLEEIYDDFRSKNPYNDYTHLAPNVILLDSIKENEELAGQKYFLEELNNMRLFSDYKVFIPPLVTDYMGMANKIHMKELIIKIWLRIKKQIKTAKQIQVGEKPFSFFDLLLQMPELVGSQNAKAISQQTVFQVILHLANLKHLRLAQDDSNLNFYILQE